LGNVQPSLKGILRAFVLGKWLALVALVAALGIAGLMEAYPIRFMQSAIDTLSTGGPWTTVLGLVGLWYACRLAGSLALFGSTVISGAVSAELSRQVRRFVFDRLKTAGLERVESIGTSETLSRAVIDASNMGEIITKPLILVGRHAFIFAWSVVFLFRMDATLLGLCLLLALVMLVAGKWVSGASRQSVEKHRTFQTQAIDTLLETVKAYRDIAVFNLWPRQTRVFSQANDGVASAQRSVSVLTGGLDNFLDALWPLATVLCLSVGGYRLLAGDLSLGSLMAFMWYVQWVIHPVSQLAYYQTQIQNSLVAARRVTELVDWLPPRPQPDAPARIAGELRLSGIEFSYSGSPPTLEGIDLVIRKGEVVAVVGQTGCGKTTLLKAILGLLRPSKGEVIADSQPVAAAEFEGSPSLAAAFGDAYLFDLSIADNVRLALDPGAAGDVLMDRALADSGVNEFCKDMPQGAETVVGEGGSRLSTGQRQRVAIARALARRPSLLVLDEATSGLDSATEDAIHRALTEWRNDLACIIVSHRLSSVINSDRIYVMDKGRVVACGTHQELLAGCPEYREIYSAQLRPEVRLG
jgi:ABC-type multidrug transport system fused ATPase/permease subunit